MEMETQWLLQGDCYYRMKMGTVVPQELAVSLLLQGSSAVRMGGTPVTQYGSRLWYCHIHLLVQPHMFHSLIAQLLYVLWYSIGLGSCFSHVWFCLSRALAVQSLWLMVSLCSASHTSACEFQPLLPISLQLFCVHFSGPFDVWRLKYLVLDLVSLPTQSIGQSAAGGLVQTSNRMGNIQL